MKCKDCKFFTANSFRGMGSCDSQFMESGYHGQSKETEDRGIVTEDDEGWGFHVGQNFGCVNFESKE